MAEAKPKHEADDGQIDLEFTEEAQEVTLEDVAESEETSSPEPAAEQNASEDDVEQYSKLSLIHISEPTRPY